MRALLIALVALGAGCSSSNPAETADASSDASQESGPEGDAGGGTDGGSMDGTASGYAGGAVAVKVGTCDAGAAGVFVTGTVAIQMVAATPAAISKIDVLVDGKTLATLTSAPFATSWSSSIVPNGAHTISGVAYDRAGRTAAATPEQVTANNFRLAGTWNWTGITDATAGFPTDSCVDTTFTVTFDETTSTATLPAFNVTCTAGNGAPYQAQVTGFTTTVTPSQYGGPLHVVQGTLTTDFSTTQLTQTQSFNGDVLSGAVSLVSAPPAGSGGSTTCPVVTAPDGGADAGLDGGSGSDAAVDAPAGTCGPNLPVMLASATSPSAITVDGTSVYWADLGAIKKVPIGGGSVTMLATGVPTGIAVDSTFVYWANDSSTAGGIMKVPIGGGSPTMLAPGNYATHLAIDSTNVYFTAGGIEQAPLAGGPVVTLANVGLPADLAVSGNYVYWIDGTGSAGGTVYRVPIGSDGGAWSVLAGGQGANGIASDATNVYYTTTSIWQLPHAGGTPVAIATNQFGAIGITVDSNYVYWTNANGGSVWRVPIGGGAACMLASGQGTPEDIAVDANNVYWTNDLTVGAVMQLAKP